MYYIYVLLCSDNDLYIGYSADLKERIENHSQGRVRSTKSKRPLLLIYYEAYRSKEDATKREKFLKTHQQKDILRERLKHSLKA